MNREHIRYGVRYKGGFHFAWFISLPDARTFFEALCAEEGSGIFEITDTEGRIIA